MPFLTLINVARPAGSNGKWRMLSPLIYQGNKDSFTVPCGFETDFASIPSAFRWLIPRHGKYDAAAILHDFLYVYQPVSRKDADGLFRKVMKELGVGRFKRHLMYRAVRFGGKKAWLRAARARSLG